MITCITAFNKVYLSLLKDLRQNVDLKKVLSKRYPAFDNSSPQYLEYFNDNIAPKLFEALCDDYSNVDHVKDLEIVKGITLGTAFESVGSETEILNKYILTLLVVWIVDSRSQEPELHVVLNKLKDMEVNPNTDLSDIFDEDITKILQMIATKKSKDDKPPMLDGIFDGDIMSMLSNSKIGAMAKEIADEIASNSEEKDITQLIGKVTTKIGSKLQSGDISQQDLLSETMQMLTKIKPSGDIMKNIASMMANLNTDDSRRKRSTHERLKHRLTNKEN